MAHRLLILRRKACQTDAKKGLETLGLTFSKSQAPTGSLISRHLHTPAEIKPTRSSTWASQLRKWSKVFQQLSKARLSALVVSTTAVGFVAGSGESINWSGLAWASVGTFGASACANTLNQIYEVANDSRMKRTMMRPLPLGRVTRLQALMFAGVMGAGGIAILAEKANMMTAGLGLANIVLYAGVYTPMKVISASNTWVGAVVGAIPPVMGWTAASGALEPGAGVLAAALYFWQMPHFLALAWLHREDYMRGGYAMLSRYDPKGHRTAAAALRNSLYMLPIGALATWVGTATTAFALEATISAGTLATTAAVFYGTPSLRSARLLFRFSLLFLPVFMLGMIVHRIPNDHSVTFSNLGEKLASGYALEPRENSSLDGGKEPVLYWPVKEFSVAPGPFLPVPMQLRSPARVGCQPEHKDEQT